MHFTRRLALGASLIGIVALALPWMSLGDVPLIGMRCWQAWVIAGLLGIGGLLSGQGDRWNPLPRRSAALILVSSWLCVLADVVFLILIILDSTSSPGFGLFFQATGSGLGIAAGMITLRREQGENS